MFKCMNQQRLPHICGVRLEPAEAQFLDRLARQNDRSRSAEMRRLLRREMLADQRQPNPVPQFGNLS